MCDNNEDADARGASVATAAGLSAQRSETCLPLSKTASGVCDNNEYENADAREASVNLQFSSFAPRHRLSKLISALGLSSVATAARSISAACDEGRFIFPEERALAPLTLVLPRSTKPKAKSKNL